MRKLILMTLFIGWLSLLTSCVIQTNHSFSGERRIKQIDHSILLTPGDLARTESDKWYLYDGPGMYQGATKVSCFKFTIGNLSTAPVPVFEMLRVEVIYDGKARGKMPIKFQPLLPEKVARPHSWETAPGKIWVLSQPSPTLMAPEIPEGSYQIKIHYRLGEKEYDAEWQGAYRTGTRVERWRLPNC